MNPNKAGLLAVRVGNNKGVGGEREQGAMRVVPYLEHLISGVSDHRRYIKVINFDTESSADTFTSSKFVAEFSKVEAKRIEVNQS